MSITINAPDIEVKLRDGANSLNISVEDYTIGMLRAALDALAAPPPSNRLATPSDPLPEPSAYYTLKVDKSPEARQAALDLLRSFDEDDLEERRQSAEYLRRALDETRSSAQPPLPSEK